MTLAGLVCLAAFTDIETLNLSGRATTTFGIEATAQADIVTGSDPVFSGGNGYLP